MYIIYYLIAAAASVTSFTVGNITGAIGGILILLLIYYITNKAHTHRKSTLLKRECYSYTVLSVPSAGRN